MKTNINEIPVNYELISNNQNNKIMNQELRTFIDIIAEQTGHGPGYYESTANFKQYYSINGFNQKTDGYFHIVAYETEKYGYEITIESTTENVNAVERMVRDAIKKSGMKNQKFTSFERTINRIKKS